MALTISGGSSSIEVGSSTTFTVRASQLSYVNPSYSTSGSGSVSVSISRTSSSPSASLFSMTVTGVSAGSVTISLSHNAGSASKSITVTGGSSGGGDGGDGGDEGGGGDTGGGSTTVLVTDITITGDSYIYVGETKTLSASVRPTNATTKTVSWSQDSGWSSYASIVSQTGTTATIRGISYSSVASIVPFKATANDSSGIVRTFRVTVRQPVESISVSSNRSEIAVGGTATISATVSPSNAYSDTVNWSIVSGSSYATLSSTSGSSVTLTGVASGTVRIRGTAADGQGAYGECTVTITSDTYCAWESTTLSLGTGDGLVTQYISASSKPSVSVSNSSVASVGSVYAVSGSVDRYFVQFTANGIGSTTAIATAGGKSSTLSISVSETEYCAWASSSPISLETGASTVKTLYASGTPAVSSSNSHVSVGSPTLISTGTSYNRYHVSITAVSAGTAVLTAKRGSESSVCTVTVSDPEPEVVESITIYGVETLYVDKSYTYSASFYPPGASSDVVWASSDPCLSITPNGTECIGLGASEGVAILTCTTTDGTDVVGSKTVSVEIKTEAPSWVKASGSALEMDTPSLELDKSMTLYFRTQSATAPTVTSYFRWIDVDSVTRVASEAPWYWYAVGITCVSADDTFDDIKGVDSTGQSTIRVTIIDTAPATDFGWETYQFSIEPGSVASAYFISENPVTFDSSDWDIVQVSGYDSEPHDGRTEVTLVGGELGTTTVRGTDGTDHDDLYVTVTYANNPNATKPVITGPTSIASGNSGYRFEATGGDTDTYDWAYGYVSYEPYEVAGYGAYCLVDCTTVGAGQFFLQVKNAEGGVSDPYYVTVTQVEPEPDDILPTKLTLSAEVTEYLFPMTEWGVIDVTMEPEDVSDNSILMTIFDGPEMMESKITYTSSNTARIEFKCLMQYEDEGHEFDAEFLVKAAAAPEVQDSIIIKFISKAQSTISISGPTTLAVNEKGSFVASLADYEEGAAPTLTWASDYSSATIVPNGNRCEASWSKLGKVNLTATDPETKYKAYHYVIIIADTDVEDIVVDPASLSLAKGQTKTVSAHVLPESSAATIQVEALSSKIAVSTTTSGRNTVASITAGQTSGDVTVRFRAGNRSKTVPVRIEDGFTEDEPDDTSDYIAIRGPHGAYLFYLPHIQSIDDTITANLTEINTIIYGAKNRFVMDLGTTQAYSIKCIRVNPPNPRDDLDDSRMWSNGKWWNEFRNALDFWQNLGRQYGVAGSPLVGGFTLHLEQDSKGFYPTVIEKNVFLSGSVNPRFDVQQLSFTLPLKVARMQETVENLPYVELRCIIDGIMDESVFVPAGISVLAPQVPADKLPKLAGKVLSHWSIPGDEDLYLGQYKTWSMKDTAYVLTGVLVVPIEVQYYHSDHIGGHKIGEPFAVTAPVGCRRVLMTLVGGGGGAGGGRNVNNGLGNLTLKLAGGGGGAGEVVDYSMPASGGDVYSCTIGKGGAGGYQKGTITVSGTTGGTGDDTIVTTGYIDDTLEERSGGRTVRARGGSGGQAAPMAASKDVYQDTHKTPPAWDKVAGGGNYFAGGSVYAGDDDKGGIPNSRADDGSTSITEPGQVGNHVEYRSDDNEYLSAAPGGAAAALNRSIGDVAFKSIGGNGTNTAQKGGNGKHGGGGGGNSYSEVNPFEKDLEGGNGGAGVAIFVFY